MILELEAGRLDLDTGRLTRSGGSAETLTGTERKLLLYLADQGRVVDRDELQRAVWGYRDGVLSRTVFTTVGRVRAKIELDPANPAHLVTVAGEGYRLDARRARASPPLTPPAATPFFGRDEVVEQLLALMPGARLLSILGPGGVGKTRLAVELARRTGGLFVPLESTQATSEVPAAIAAAAGAQLAGSPDPWGELAAGVDLGGRLCILDNVEQLPGLAAPLATWLAASPGLRVCVTSRIRLGSRWETSFHLAPLGVPPPGAPLADSPAGALLLHHARRSRPAWEPSSADDARLGEVCRRIGGSPLAVELAAAWLRVLEPGELLDEIERGTPLATDDPDTPERHRNLDLALAASWRLVSESTARVLENLGVFHAAFERRAAAEVAGADLGALGQLVDASLVHRDGGRFDLHPLVRQQARARLAARADAADTHARHARWFLGRLVATVDRADWGAQAEVEAFAELGAEHAELLAAWYDRVEARDLDTLATAAHPLYRYLDQRNRFGELRQAFEAAYNRLDRAEPRSAQIRTAMRLLCAGAGHSPEVDLAMVEVDLLPPPLRVAALTHAAIVGIGRHQLTLAATLAGQAIDCPGGSPFQGAFAHALRGSVGLRLGTLDAARADLVRGRDAAAGGRGPARCAFHLAEVDLYAGQLAAARVGLEAALGRCRQTDDRAFCALALCRLGQALEGLGEDPVPVWREAVEEGVGSRLPRIWWSGALLGLGRRWARDAGRVQDGVVLLAAAAASPSMDPPGLADDALAELPAAVRGMVRPGEVATDAELLEVVRRD